jgi:N-sulfoglucosamine sulfohydrolase
MSDARFTRRDVLRSAAVASPAAAQPRTGLPNIVFLISDDHSVPDLGCYGNSAIRTPNLDRMAREGMRFQNAIVASPQCSPNRSAIFTGCSPHTTSTSRLHTPFPEWERTYIEGLQERGYFVGAFRKVHQGEEFDKRWNWYGGMEIDFERFFQAAPAGKPFFLHVGFTDPHRPYKSGAVSPPHDPAKVVAPKFLPDSPEVRADIAHYYDYISRMDAQCGQLFDQLRKRKLEKDTLVIFTGDNGMPFPRAKGTCYEPGIRVPLLAWWPGRISAGAVRNELISHVDLPATWLDAAGVEPPKKMQGRSFLNLLLGKEYKPNSAVFSERNWHDNFDPIRCVRTARYKLIFNAMPQLPYRPTQDLENSPSWQSYVELARRGKLSLVHRRLLDPSRPMLELYDLETDPDEFSNLAGDPKHAAVLEGLLGTLADWMHATRDYLPPAFPRRGLPAGRGWPLSL